MGKRGVRERPVSVECKLSQREKDVATRFQCYTMLWKGEGKPDSTLIQPANLRTHFPTLGQATKTTSPRRTDFECAYGACRDAG